MDTERHVKAGLAYLARCGWEVSDEDSPLPDSVWATEPFGDSTALVLVKVVKSNEDFSVNEKNWAIRVAKERGAVRVDLVIMKQIAGDRALLRHCGVWSNEINRGGEHG